jgi:hypothetical protein
MKNSILIFTILFIAFFSLNAAQSDTNKWKLVYNLETDLPVKPNAEDSMYRWENFYSIQKADSLNYFVFGNTGACYGLILKSTDLFPNPATENIEIVMNDIPAGLWT